jgi:hypothetical protein
MAKQRGIIKLEGTISDITFQKTKDGYLAKEKSQIAASKINSDPAFERTRENMAEFARAGRAGKLLRQAFRAQLQQAADSRVTSRLTREFMRVIQSDTVNPRGQRVVSEGQFSYLENFEFNVNGKLATTLFAPYTVNLNRATGAAGFSLAPFVPISMVGAPSGATHFQLFAAAAAVDFGGQGFVVDNAETAVLPWDVNPTQALTLTLSLPPASTHTLFVGLGVGFVQEVNGGFYPLKNGAFNAMAIVKVEN